MSDSQEQPASPHPTSSLPEAALDCANPSACEPAAATGMLADVQVDWRPYASACSVRDMRRSARWRRYPPRITLAIAMVYQRAREQTRPYRRKYVD